MTVYTFESIAVYAELGGALRLARGARAFTTDPTTGAPVDATQGARVAPYVDADAAGDVSFTAESWPVRLTSGATYEDVWPVDVSVAGFAAELALKAPRLSTQIYMSAYDTTAQGGDSTADFQAAFNAAKVLLDTKGHCQLILDSKLHYYIKGAVTAGAYGEWSQVHFPYSAWGAGGWFEIVGQPGGQVLPDQHVAPGGTIIESTLATAPAFVSTRGIASVFGTKASYQYGNAFTPHSGVGVGIKGVIFVQQPNPPITCVDAGYAYGVDFDALTCATLDFIGVGAGGEAAAVVPTSPQAVGVIYPLLNNWESKAGTVAVLGYYAGHGIGENLHADELLTSCCIASLVMDSAYGPNRLDSLFDTESTYGIAALDPATGIVAPSASGKGSGHTGNFASPLIITHWLIQRNNLLANVAFNRLWDVYDPNGATPIQATATRIDTAVGNVTPANFLVAPGSTLTTITDLLARTGVYSPTPRTVTGREPWKADFCTQANPFSIVQGTTQWTAGGVYVGGYLRWNPSAAAGDGAVWGAELSAGTWTLDCYLYAASSIGKVTVDMSFDRGATWTGAIIGALDLYSAAGTTLNFVVGDINVPMGGLALLRFRVLTKSASASGYGYGISGAIMSRTA